MLRRETFERRLAALRVTSSITGVFSAGKIPTICGNRLPKNITDQLFTDLIRKPCYINKLNPKPNSEVKRQRCLINVARSPILQRDRTPPCRAAVSSAPSVYILNAAALSTHAVQLLAVDLIL